MLNDEKISVYKTQKAKKPNVKDAIEQICDGDIKQKACDFTDYLINMRMKPIWASTNSYSLSYKEKRVGYFKLGGESSFEKNLISVSVYPVSAEFYDEYLLNKTDTEKERFMGEFTSSYIKYCTSCSKCTPGKDIIILGKKYKNICKHQGRHIINPTNTQINFIKELIDMRRIYIKNCL
jgi:hypothetical protein